MENKPRLVALPSSPTQSGVATMAVEGNSDHATPEAPPLQPGVHLGAYEVRRLLGRGGMGDVYEVEHKKLGRRAALKLLKPDLARDRIALRRFFGEARAVGRVGHPGLVNVFDLVESEAHAFFVMELLEGETLSARLSRTAPFAQSFSLNIARQVADTMAAVHRAGIVHRDLKPDNIFLIDNGEGGKSTKILDFGVAKLKKGVDVSDTMMTAAGAVIGTPAYMSPEQISSTTVDARSDVYALGIVLFEMVTGGKPFVAKTYGEFMLAHMAARPKKPSDIVGARVSPALEKLIVDCMAKKPDQRPADMDEVRRRLDRVSAFPEQVEGTWPDEMVPSAASSSADPGPRGFRVWAGGALGALLLLGLAFAAPFFADSSPSPPPVTTKDAPQVVAPVVAPAPSAPAKPSAVTHMVMTTPTGAQVWDVAANRPVGKTPLKLKRPPQAEDLVLRISLAGHLPREVRLAGDSATQTELVLVRRRPPQKRAGPRVDRSAPRVDDDAVIDPFAP